MSETPRMTDEQARALIHAQELQIMETEAANGTLLTSNTLRALSSVGPRTYELWFDADAHTPRAVTCDYCGRYQTPHEDGNCHGCGAPLKPVASK